MEEDPENAEDLFGSAYFDEVFCSWRVFEPESAMPGPDRRPKHPLLLWREDQAEHGDSGFL